MPPPFLVPLRSALLFLAVVFPALADIVINELHYAPDPENEAVEFIELYNSGAESVDLSGWSFTDGFAYTFPADSNIAADAYLVLAPNLAEYNRKFGSIFIGGAKAFGEFESGFLSNGGEEITLRTATGEVADRVNYGDSFPWPTAAGGDGVSMELIHPELDNDLGGSWRSSAGPTPGDPNSVLADKAAPHIRQVSHSPKIPKPGEEVVISAKVTDPEGVQSVVLRHQVVEPGNYIQVDDEAFLTDWVEVTMADDGVAPDVLAGDDIYTIALAAELQEHRHLLRYQITVTDAEGTGITVPYADDAQPNFAYFTYGTMPDWAGAVEPGVTNAVTYSADLLQTVPVYYLITSSANHTEAQNIPGKSGGTSGYTGSDYRWKGTLVYDGEVYDHISYRARGGVWRYAMGKNMWKFLFNRGREFQARNELGEKYPTKWKRLNFSAIIQQGNFNHRGEQGLFESVGFELFDKAGVEAPDTHYLHFRIIKNNKEEAKTIFGSNQYGGDFQGLYLAIEQLDARFMRAHGLPEGNLYKMENGTGVDGNNGELKSLSVFPAVSDSSDLRAFKRNGYEKNPDEAWYRENLDLPRYYAYRSIVEGIHHYDIGNGKNYFYYHNPETGKWATLPWDLDLTWADNMYGPGTEPFQHRVAEVDPFEGEYHNKLREVMDLLYNPEQTGLLVDEKASAVYTPGKPSLVDADRAMWDHNPIMSSKYVNSSKSGEGRYYRIAKTDDFPGMMQILKNYVVKRSTWMESRVLDSTDSKIPNTPTITSIGSADYKVDDLRFETSEFKGGSIFARQDFAALKWRLAEITDVTSPDFDPTPPNKYEIDSVWESAELTEFTSTVAIPAEAVKPSSIYRVRARMKNTNNLWSHWSDPIQFEATVPDIQPYLDGLVISEILYFPEEATPDQLAMGYETADFEFIELLNIGNRELDLTNVRFTKGIDYDFSTAPVSIAPGQRLLLVRNQVAFENRYGAGLPIAGVYTGNKLNNQGERLKLSFGAGIAIRDLTYDNGNNWPDLARGKSLTLATTDAITDHASPESWGASSQLGGTPSAADDAVVVTPPNVGGTLNFAQWQTNAFSTDHVADSTISGPEADPDEDGFVNLQEYAFASSPNNAASTPSITIAWTENQAKLTTILRSDAADLTVCVEKSTDLITWTTHDGNSNYLDNAQADVLTRVTTLDDAEATYYRIVTTLN